MTNVRRGKIICWACEKYVSAVYNETGAGRTVNHIEKPYGKKCKGSYTLVFTN